MRVGWGGSRPSREETEATGSEELKVGWGGVESQEQGKKEAGGQHRRKGNKPSLKASYRA